MRALAGIDFGTSNSAVSYIHAGEVKMAEVEPGAELIPTALFFMAETNRRLYGNEAIRAFLNQSEGRFMRSIKSILGTSMMDAYTRVNKYNIDFKDIIRYFISHLKTRLETEAGDKELSVVFGRPVKFNEDNEALDRQGEDMLRSIAGMTGFKEVEFQYEPIAAAFLHERELSGEKLAMVLDIGGGTSDFAIIKIGEKLRDKIDRLGDILACTGLRLGGNDFDKDLNFFSFMPLFGKDASITEKKLPAPSHIYYQLSDWSGINTMYDRDNMRSIRDMCRESNDKEKTNRLLHLVSTQRAHELLGLAEETKIRLTREDPVNCNLGPVLDELSVTVTRDEFNGYIQGYYEKIQKALDECIRQAGKRNTDIELVILTGGSTDIIRIKELTQKTFPQALISGQNKFSSVCQGLAYDAQRRFG